MNSCFAAERYDFTPLPFIPFSNTGGEALNNNGVVVGGIANSDGSVSLAEWSKGVLTNLGVPPGLPSHDFNIPRVFGINDCGAVVGTIHTSAGDIPSRWFIYDRGRFTVLPLADPTDLGGAAIGINNRGEVVGYDHTSSNRRNRVALVQWRLFQVTRIRNQHDRTGHKFQRHYHWQPSFPPHPASPHRPITFQGRTRLCSKQRHDSVSDWVCLRDKRVG